MAEPAAGTIANFIAGAIGLVAFKATNPVHKPQMSCFLWLFTTLNLLMGAGYFLFSGVGNIGDWVDVASGTVSPVIWRPAMAVLGGALYFLLARRSGQWLGALIGSDDLSVRRSGLLSVPAYIAGGLLFCLAGLFNPVGPVLIAISAAAASFGGASGLLWLTQFTRAADRSAEPVALDRSYAWIVAGCSLGCLRRDSRLGHSFLVELSGPQRPGDLVRTEDDAGRKCFRADELE